MNSYEISHKLCEYGYDGDNTNQTASMLYLLDAAKLFGISEDNVWEALSRKHSLYGHIGHVYIGNGTKSLWFCLLDSEEIARTGKRVRYSLRSEEFDQGYANGDVEIEILA